MSVMFRNLVAILWKNGKIRKRHWLLTITECLVPTVLFLVMAYARSNVSGLNKVYINESTYHSIHHMDVIYSHLNVGPLKLWYAPENSNTTDIIQKIQEKLGIFGTAITAFNNREEMLSHKDFKDDSLIAALVFHQLEEYNLDYDLTIHDKNLNWNTDKLFIPSFQPKENENPSYISKGFAALQLAVEISYTELFHNQYETLSISLQQFPDPPHVEDSKLNKLFVHFLPAVTIFSFIFLCPAVLQRVGEEKANGTKELMKMVGLKSSQIWFGWFVYALGTTIFSIVVIVVLMKVPLWEVPYSLIEHSDGTVLFVFLFLYCMAAITFCFLVANIFKIPFIATLFGILFWIISYFLPQIFVRACEIMSWKYKILFGVLPNMALYYGYSSISVYEMREIGVQWSNLFKPGSGDDQDITMGAVFILLIMQTVFFMLLTLYIESVSPGKYGIPKLPGYPLNAVVKFFKKCLSCKNKREKSTSDQENDPLSNYRKKTIPIQIQNLKKTYFNSVALDGLDLNVHKNNITVLLGENGAGKTTMMSILTGMLNATSGSVLIDGKDIKQDTDDVRKIMGLCPQHNLLFTDLTVKEHLKFFAKIRNIKDPKTEIESVLKKLDMWEKRKSLPNTLSGGMKRKLCLALALIGSSKVLILDEPTSGMDPESRRQVWDLLIEYKKSKTVLISTHFMEEAEAIGDKIVIIANGKVQSEGTPSQLKQKYDTGYNLSLKLESKDSIRQIQETVLKYFPYAKVKQETNDSIIYLLPFVNYGVYHNLLVELEQYLEIIDININASTLNDVFLRAKEENDRDIGAIGYKIDETDTAELIKEFKFGLWKSFVALLLKRIYFLKYTYRSFLLNALIGNAIFIFAILLTMSNNNIYRNNEPSLKLSLDSYGNTKVFHGPNSTNFTETLKLCDFYSYVVQAHKSSNFPVENVPKEIIERGIENVADYKKHMIAAAEFIYTDNKTVIKAMFSADALHSIPVTINLATNAMVNFLTKNVSINIRNNPIKPLASQLTPSELSLLEVSSIWLMLVPISFFFFGSNFIVFPYSEVSTKFIKLQLNTGITSFYYWITNMFFDVMFSIILVVVLVASLYSLNCFVFNGNGFSHYDILAITVIFGVYITMSLPFTYLFSYRSTVSGGVALYFTIGVFLGTLPTLLVAATELSKESNFTSILEHLEPILIVLSPQFALSNMSLKFLKKYVENFNWKVMNPAKRDHICQTEPNPCCFDSSSKTCRIYQSYFQNEKLGIQNDLMFMLAACVTYFVILLMLNDESWCKFTLWVKNLICCNGDLAKNPLNEEDKALVVQDLSKNFKEKPVVNKLSFKLIKSQCFGLLGVNGAGKSTTISMLTKYLLPDEGIIQLKEESKVLKIKDSQYTKKIGYCPQDNSLNFFLSGKELLFSMALLKGYSWTNAKTTTTYLLNKFGLTNYADKPCKQYSGGNKRKLNTALAFLGYPSIIFLDEPTSGVDPVSQRKFWEVLSDVKKMMKSTFLLCSHSMEECENLCDEIIIMKKGEIKEQGSPVSLKRNLQRKYKVTIELKPDSNKADKINKTEKISNKLQGKLREQHGDIITLEVENNRLSRVFQQINELKYNCPEDIKTVLIDSTSLEDVFLSVAEKHDDASTIESSLN